MDILKPGKLSPPADLKRDEFDADNERILLAKENVDVIFIGDSITEGWNVRNAFADLGNVYNRGISGDVIDIILRRIEADAVQMHPRVCVVHGGINNTFPFFSVPEDELPDCIEQAYNLFCNSYRSIFDLCKQNRLRIIACAITPLAEQPSPGATARKETVVRMNTALKEMCAAYGVPFADYHTPLVQLDGFTAQDGLTYDGLHPNDNGYVRLDAVIRPILTALLI